MSTIREKDVILEPIILKSNGLIIIDSINNNSFEWQIDKTIEELLSLATALLQYKKKDVSPEHICQELADVFVQTHILTHLFSAPMTQKFILKRLVTINNRNQRISKTNNFKHQIGFTISGEPHETKQNSS